MIRTPPGQGRIWGGRIIRRPVQFDRVYSIMTGFVTATMLAIFHVIGNIVNWNVCVKWKAVS
jgi:hypothetical protein